MIKFKFPEPHCDVILSDNHWLWMTMLVSFQSSSDLTLQCVQPFSSSSSSSSSSDITWQCVQPISVRSRSSRDAHLEQECQRLKQMSLFRAKKVGQPILSPFILLYGYICVFTANPLCILIYSGRRPICYLHCSPAWRRCLEHTRSDQGVLLDRGEKAKTKEVMKTTKVSMTKLTKKKTLKIKFLVIWQMSGSVEVGGGGMCRKPVWLDSQIFVQPWLWSRGRWWWWWRWWCWSLS